MSLPDTKAEKSDASARQGRLANGKIVEFKKTLQARKEAVGGWAHERADKVRSTAEQRPFATAGVAAGIALVGGIALGLLLSGQMAGLKRTLETRKPTLTARARSFFRR